jgi:hypothetical protein
MLLHLALGALTRRGLLDRPAVEAELFGIPNRFLGTPTRIRLLRVRYLLPFRRLPDGVAELDPWVRTNLAAARVTGFCLLCAVAGFFVAILAEATP